MMTSVTWPRFQQLAGDGRTDRVVFLMSESSMSRNVGKSSESVQCEQVYMITVLCVRCEKKTGE